jgi:hypothetical protein
MEQQAFKGDGPEFLFTRSAVVWLGIAAVFSLGAVVMMHFNLTLDTPSRLNREALLVAGVATAIGYVSLLVGMSWFWLKSDVSSKRSRTVWFVILLLGFAYGSQIAYYALVYVPAVGKRLRNPRGETLEPPAKNGARSIGVGALGWVLLAGWILFLLTVAIYFAFPFRMYPILRPIVVEFAMWPVLMLAATAAYAVVFLFRVGMRRPSSS